MSRARRPATAFIGAGRLACALAPLLHERGYPVIAVTARRRASATALARRIPGARPLRSVAEVCGVGRLLLLAVPDRELTRVAEELAAARPGRGRVVLHHAGALGLEPLRPLRERGYSVGLLHPLQVLRDADLARQLLPGSRARIEGMPAARRLALRLAADLGLVPLRALRRLGAEDRVAYHAAAALVSNDWIGLLDLATELLGTAGYARRAALEALAPLAHGALLQAERAGPGAALTGPVVRGDVETVAAHLRCLERRMPQDVDVHRALSARLLRLAGRARRPISADARRRLRALLDVDGAGRTRR